jgi:hypothetical protein
MLELLIVMLQNRMIFTHRGYSKQRSICSPLVPGMAAKTATRIDPSACPSQLILVPEIDNGRMTSPETVAQGKTTPGSRFL